MKHIITFFLSLCLIFSATGCSSKNDDDILLFFDAFNETLEAESGNISGTVTIKNDSTSKMNLNIQFNQENDLQLALTLGLEAGGNTKDDYLDFYIKDGKTYLQNEGTKTQSLASNIGIEDDQKISAYNPFLNFTDDELTEIFTSSEKDGNTYTYQIDKDIVATLLDSLGTVSISEASLVATIEDDVIKDFKLVASGTQTVNDTTIDFSFTIEADITNLNNQTEVSFPDDLDTYIDQSQSTTE